jgi:undecaprenyl diphosphate synthase
MLTAQSTGAEDGGSVRHIAIIMDGNGRWARARNLPRVAGHRRGADSVRATVTACRELGIPYLTLYAFSSENWRRPAAEVDDLMGLLRLYLRQEVQSLNRSNVRLRFIGDHSKLSVDIVKLITQAQDLTADNTGLVLTIALNYGSHDEILDAVRRVSMDVKKGALSPEDITGERFAGYLHTAGTPDPDMIIRTSGEKRLSNFLLWQAAYSELVFLDVFWPDFNKDSLIEAINEFRGRERRYGRTSG